MKTAELKARLSKTAFAFRGYNVTNLGRTSELLEHPAYGATVERHLKAASELCSSVTGRHCNLVARVRANEETSLETYGEALCLISGATLAQLEILKQFFGIEFSRAKLALGYSLGEVIAAVAAGVYSLDALLKPILSFTGECVELAQTVRMGVIFSRGPMLNLEAIERLCVEVTSQGQGTIAISTYLSPNTVLVLGQDGSLDALKAAIKVRFDREVFFKENPHRWPPIHTPIVRQRHISDRAAVLLETIPGGFQAPTIPIESCVTGRASYNDYNSRRIFSEWVSHPQRLWSALERMLSQHVEVVIHVGPDPNIIPATLERIRNNVETQLNQGSLTGFSLRAVSRIVRYRPWLATYLSKNAALLRVPQIHNIILEDWLLANTPA